MPALTALVAAGAALGSQLLSMTQAERSQALAAQQTRDALALEAHKHESTLSKELSHHQLELEERYVEKIANRQTDIPGRRTLLTWLEVRFDNEPLGTWAIEQSKVLEAQIEDAQKLAAELKRKSQDLAQRLIEADGRPVDTEMRELEEGVRFAHDRLLAVQRELEAPGALQHEQGLETVRPSPLAYMKCVDSSATPSELLACERLRPSF